jgi:hypothetical protein
VFYKKYTHGDYIQIVEKAAISGKRKNASALCPALGAQGSYSPYFPLLLLYMTISPIRKKKAS